MLDYIQVGYVQFTVHYSSLVSDEQRMRTACTVKPTINHNKLKYHVVLKPIVGFNIMDEEIVPHFGKRVLFLAVFLSIILFDVFTSFTLPDNKKQQE